MLVATFLMIYLKSKNCNFNDLKDEKKHGQHFIYKVELS